MTSVFVGQSSNIRIVIQNRQLVTVKDITTAYDVQWQNILPLGNDTAEFKLPLPIEDMTFLDSFFRVQIFYNGINRWSGYIENIEADVLEFEYVQVSCNGYGHGFDLRTIENVVFAGVDSGSLITALAEVFIGTGAPHVLSDCHISAVTPSGYVLNNFVCQLLTVTDAINQLSIMAIDIFGNPFEWLIDETKGFTYRRPASGNATSFSFIGRDVIDFKFQRGPSSSLVNNVFFTGQVSTTGQQAQGQVDNLSSIATFGQIDGTYQFGALSNANDLSTSAADVLAQTSSQKDRYQVTILRPNDLPSDLTNIKVGDIHQVGGFSNGVVFAFKVVLQRFTMKDTGLECYMELGAPKGTLAGTIGAQINNIVNTKLNTSVASTSAGINSLSFPIIIGSTTFGANTLPGTQATNSTSFPPIPGFSNFGAAAGSGFYQPTAANVPFTGQMWSDTMTNIEALVGGGELGEVFRDDFVGFLPRPEWSFNSIGTGFTFGLISGKNGVLQAQTGTSTGVHGWSFPGGDVSKSFQWVDPTKNPNLAYRFAGAAGRVWNDAAGQSTLGGGLAGVEAPGSFVWLGYTTCFWFYGPTATGNKNWNVGFTDPTSGDLVFTQTKFPYNFGTFVPMAIQVVDNSGTISVTYWFGGNPIVTLTTLDTRLMSPYFSLANDNVSSPSSNVTMNLDYVNITQLR